jgi:hypothetical protein
MGQSGSGVRAKTGWLGIRIMGQSGSGVRADWLTWNQNNGSKWIRSKSRRVGIRIMGQSGVTLFRDDPG